MHPIDGDNGGTLATPATTGLPLQPANVMPADVQCQSEVKKLRTENCILRDANKQLEDKNQVISRHHCSLNDSNAFASGQIFCKADRQKTNDVRQVKESYELKLAQTSKSANVEIHRLVSVPGTRTLRIHHISH